MIKFWNRKQKDFIKDTKGVVVPIFGMVAFGLVTVSMSAVDVYQFSVATAELQALADKSTLSAVSLRDNRTTAGDRIEVCESTFREAMLEIENVSKTVRGAKKGVICKYDEAHKIVTLEAYMDVKTSFASGIGLDTFKTIVRSSASMNYVPQEVVIAVSTSGTMCAINQVLPSEDGNFLRIQEDTDCKKIQMVREGLDNFFNQLKNIDHLSVGLIPYTYKVRFPDINKIPPSLKNSTLITKDGTPNNAIKEDSQFYTEFSKEPELGSIIGLQSADDKGNNVKNIKEKFAKEITTNIDTVAWARMDLPLHVAGLMLDPANTEYFNYQNKTDTPKDWDTTKKTVQKSIILMSDGTNLGGVYTNYPTDHFDNQYLYQYKPYNQHALDVCKVLEKKGVRIFMVLLNVPPGATGRENIENIMARCAMSSSDTTGYKPTEKLKCKDYTDCYDAQAITALPDIFADIGRKLKQIKLRK